MIRYDFRVVPYWFIERGVWSVSVKQVSHNVVPIGKWVSKEQYFQLTFYGRLFQIMPIFV